ncbi:Protein MAK32 [Fusarium oxysporum f. sp. albedinis]|nr:Protein MAK32 [Fusarium oxysporum f. sp. albedinis]
MLKRNRSGKWRFGHTSLPLARSRSKLLISRVKHDLRLVRRHHWHLAFCIIQTRKRLRSTLSVRRYHGG